MESLTTINDKNSLRSLMQHLGENGVDTLTNYIEAKFRMNNKSLLEKLATKEDISLVKGDIARLETDVSGLKTDVSGLKADVSELKKDVSGLKTDVSELKKDVSGLKEAITCIRVDIPTLQSKLDTKISAGNTEILRWIVTLFGVTMLTIFGLYFKI